MSRWTLVGCLALAAVSAVAVFDVKSATGAVPSSDVEVVLKSQNTVGLRPDGSTVLIDIKLEVTGSDTSSLTGAGRHFGSGGTHAYWDVTGAIAGNVMTLVGTVQDTNNPNYLGTPIRVTADLGSDLVTFEFGPLTGGPYVGHTIVTQGSGRVQITD